MSRSDERAVSEKTCRNRTDPGDYRPLGGVRRKLRPLRRQMACARSDSILFIRRSGVGYPIETVDPLDTDGIVPCSSLVVTGVLGRYITVEWLRH